MSSVTKTTGNTVQGLTTTSEVTACEPGATFAFSAEGYTTWTYTFEPAGEGTKVTESFSYEAKGFQGFMYDKVLFRPRMMTKGMHGTLQRVKAVLEQ